MKPPYMLLILVTAGYASAAVVSTLPSATIEPRVTGAADAAVAACTLFKPDRQCYGGSSKTPSQNLVISDIGHVASDTRKVALQNGADYPSWLFHEANATSPQCEMVDLLSYGTAKIRVLYLDNTLSIAVLAEEIARTLDGGRLSDGGSTADSRAASLLSCGTNGGQRQVMVNTSNPEYSSDWFRHYNYTTNGVILMLLHSTST